MAIQLLPENVIDQIAAGEVVERPAHMVKEIIENSLDAGATEIEVEFSQGGRNVCVRDNGSGIDKAELRLAVSRHATSKIALAEDLWSLSSYGFRGEALATIAAVSRLRLTSRPALQKQGATLVSEFGNLSEVVEQGAESGTTVWVEDLFANTPARLKFLRTAAAEGMQIKNILRACALINPHIGFRLRQDKELLFHWPATDSLVKRAEQVLGVTPLFSHEFAQGAYRAQVALAPPHLVEKNSRQIWLFVQGRYVQDRALQAAVMDAYRSLLMHGEYPIAVVDLRLPPAEVDINIHPSKSQVKFLDSSKAFRVVHHAVRDILALAPWQVSAPAKSVPPLVKSVDKDLDFKDTYPSSAQTSFVKEDTNFTRTQYPKRVLDAGVSFAALKEAAQGLSPIREAIVQGPAVAVGETATQEKKVYWSNLQVLGQVNLTYIVAQDENRLILVDQHAAHERVAFEKLMATWRGGQIEVQQFLLPLTIDLSAYGSEKLLEQSQALEKLGLSIEANSTDEILVRAAPALLNEKAIYMAVEVLAQELSEQGDSFAMEKSVSEVCATMACHSVVRAGQSLSLEQAKSILEQMDEHAFSSFCPHGRPVSIEWSWGQLEKQFGRTV